MSVKLNSSGGGSVTLSEPVTASNLTVTLPTTTGTAVIQNASNDLLMSSGYGSDAVAYGCRAWVNFNGTGTVAIRGSANVTSITDNGVGIYTVNLTTAMPDTNFCISTGCGLGTVTNPTTTGISTYSTTTIEVRTFQGSNSIYDQANVMVAVFR